MSDLKTAVIGVLVVIVVAFAVHSYYTPHFNPASTTSNESQWAVFGRTLCPWCPPADTSKKDVVINKRTSPSGEGEFVRPGKK